LAQDFGLCLKSPDLVTAHLSEFTSQYIDNGSVPES